jgi:hypothetical protein
MSLESESGTFELRWEDAKAIASWLIKHRRLKYRRSRVVWVLLWVIVTGIGVVMFQSRHGLIPEDVESGIAMFAFGFIAGAAVILIVSARARAARGLTKKTFLTDPIDQWQRGPWRVRIGPVGIENISPLASSMYRWNVIRSMGQTDDHMIFMISSQRGVAVPRRAFISDQLFDDFADSAKRFRRDAMAILAAERAGPNDQPMSTERPSTDIRL